MNKKITAQKYRSFLDKLELFFASWHFPVFMLSVLFFFTLLIVGITFIPASNSVFGSFVEGFKTWCLGYDPATGEIQYMYLVMFIVQPVMLSLFIAAFWYQPLVDLVKTAPGKAVPHIAVAMMLVEAIGLTLPAFSSSNPRGELPFPAEELRTEIPPPAVSLIDQHNERISLENYRGKVVMITAIYASCTSTCPLILEEVREVLNELDTGRSNQVSLMALTMDPQKDTPDMLKMTAEHYKLTEPNQHLLTGEPDQVNAMLDQLNISRKRSEDGAINHASVFLLVDKQGKIAYRFTLGDRQKKWLLKATRLLMNEAVSASEKNLSSLKYESE